MDVRQSLTRYLWYPLALWRSGELAELHHLRAFERSQFFPPERLREIQLGRLRVLVEHAYRACPFYRERFDRAGLTPDDIRQLEDLKALPPLERRDIQEQRDRMVARGWPADDLIANQSGGSTGAPVSFFLNRDRLCARHAATVRHNRWAGLDVGHKVALLWSNQADAPPTGWKARLRGALLHRQLWLNAANLSDEKMAAFHRAVWRFRPRALLAYASCAALFARYLRTRGLEPYRPHAVITSAEVLTPENRALVEETFGCPVFNRYGSRELSVIASECPERNGMHVMAEGLYVEVVRGGEHAKPGEPGAIVVTDLLNFAMPLIRYRIGDVGVWADQPCPCGRGLPRLAGVSGRVSDFVVGSDGRVVSGIWILHTLLAHRVSLGQMQIRQQRPGQVHYRIRPGAAFDATKDLAYVVRESRRHLGEETVVEWEFVDELRSEPSGKFLFCHSAVTPDFLRPAAARPPCAVEAAHTS
jgi:phenylacetate-CoA ligase